MNEIMEARRSQTLLDSIHELIANQQEVVKTLALTSTKHSPPRVMLPMTGVAFMPATVACGSVLVGLGGDYYVERTPQQAQKILERRISDLTRHAAAVVDRSIPIVSGKPADVPRKLERTRSKTPATTPWNKGFLSTRSVRPPARGSPQGARNNPSASGKSAGSPPKPCLDGMRSRDSVAEEDTDVSKVEKAGEDPIVDIREWLDESGKHTSVDVTDLGKVLQKPPALETDGVSALQRQRVQTDGGANVRGYVRGSSHLDSVLDRLEKEEAEAEAKAQEAKAQKAKAEAKKACNPSLEPTSKTAFLDGVIPGDSAARPRPARSTIANHRSKTRIAVKDSSETSDVTEPVPSRRADAQAFREDVVQKTVIVGNSITNPDPKSTYTAEAPSRVSRFKARRKGL